ncbi:MAG: DUF2207 domain-containing protein [Candidatus Levyibacteriota bacterium]
MKRLLFFILGLSFIFSPQLVFADDSWLIENFHSDIAIQDSGKVRMVETISVDFRNQAKHGIYRDIPYLYDNNGTQTYTDVTINNVLLDNIPVPYTTSQTNGYKELKIGDPNKLVTGRNLYTITYTVTGVLLGFSDHDELYWNVTGNNWEVPIQKADAIVTLPESGLKQITCYEGLNGSQMPCLSKQESPQLASFSTTTKLAPTERLSIVVGYKKGMIPLLTAQPPKTFLQQLIAWQSLVTIVGIFLLGVAGIMSVWYRYGRDFWLAGQLFGTKDEKGKAKPVGAHETISVEFTPPENLRPAELGVLMDERADTLDVVATMIDLASRGHFTITEIPKKWLFGKVDYLLVKTTPQAKRKNIALLDYEQLLLDKLFYKRSQIKVSSLKQTFYEDLQEVKQALYDDVVVRGLFPEDPENLRNKYRVFGLGIIFVGVLALYFSYTHGLILLADVGIGVGIATAKQNVRFDRGKIGYSLAV